MFAAKVSSLPAEIRRYFRGLLSREGFRRLCDVLFASGLGGMFASNDEPSSVQPVVPNVCFESRADASLMSVLDRKRT